MKQWHDNPLAADIDFVLKLVLNQEHLNGVLVEAVKTCRRRLTIATANVKNVHVPVPGGRRSRSIVDLLGDLADRDIEVRLLHAAVPSESFLQRLKAGLPETMTMRRCPRVHIKAVIVDGRRMYLGSANLTGAALGAKSPRRRNFEGGVWTDELRLIEPIEDMLQEIWSGRQCSDCGRRDHCPVPLEEPDL